MSITTAIPVPSEPKPVPNRTIDVCNVVSDAGLLSLSDVAVVDNPYTVASDYTRYLLPGTALAAALAELELASEELENASLQDGYLEVEEALGVWREARRKVRDLLGEGRGK